MRTGNPPAATPDAVNPKALNPPTKIAGANATLPTAIRLAAAAVAIFG